MKSSQIVKYIKFLLNIRQKTYLSFRNFLGFYPFDIELYKLALSNKSNFTKDKNGHLINNERLEFLGDAVLEAIVTDILYHRFPKEKEGALTILRSRIVQRKMLNKIGMQIGLSKLVKATLIVKPFNIYGNTLEALIGAIYLDRGYVYAHLFVEAMLQNNVKLEKLLHEESNYKAKVQEWVQKNKLKFSYEITESDNPKSNCFVAKLYIEDVLVGSGTAFSKKDAQQKAAEQASRRLTPNNPIVKEILSKKNQLKIAES